ncbi:GapA-binding peptide SR1P [Gracilibacillus dipsosauri]
MGTIICVHCNNVVASVETNGVTKYYSYCNAECRKSRQNKI